MKHIVNIIIAWSLTIGVLYASDDSRVTDIQKINLALQKATQDDFLDKKESNKLRSEYISLIDKYPEWYGGYDGLSALAYINNDCKAAISNATKANSKQQNSSSYHTLTLCYTKTGKYEKAVNAANTTFSMNENIKKNSEFMIYSALAFTEVGKYEVAKNLLAMILREKPGIKSNKNFLMVGRNLAARMREAGLIE